nr:reverse transcriptase domain-containing protein [Tanacetum cinerariifolium]
SDVQKVILLSYVKICRSAVSELHNKRGARRGVWDVCGSKGLDILEPLPEGPDKLKFIIVAIDYFTKWIKAKPLAKTTEQRRNAAESGLVIREKGDSGDSGGKIQKEGGTILQQKGSSYVIQSRRFRKSEERSQQGQESGKVGSKLGRTVSEYEALLARLRIARKMKVQTLDVKVDLKLVAFQMNGEFIASNKGVAKYLAKAKEQAALFKKFSIKNIPRNQNQKANVLSKLASVSFNHLTKEILVEVLNSKSMDVQEVSMIVEEEEDNWMTLIIKCLEEGVWPTDENESRTLQMEIGQYVVEDGVMFKKSYFSPMLRCVGPL